MKITHSLFQQSFKKNNAVKSSKKDRKYNGQTKKDKRTNNYVPSITQKTKDRAIPTRLNTGDELMCAGRASSSCSTCVTRRVSAKRHEHHLLWKRSIVHINRDCQT